MDRPDRMYLVIDLDSEEVLDGYDADWPSSLDDALEQAMIREAEGREAVEVHEHPSPGEHPEHIARIIAAWESERAQ